MTINVFQIHKRNSYVFKNIQDKYSIDINQNIFAVSDGATQGYKSEIWAEILTRSFKNNPTFEVKKLMALFKNAAEEFSNIDFGVNENVALRTLESRKKELGSFATFLGISVKNDYLHYISTGDVCAFRLNENTIQSFPFKSLGELDVDKGFLGTAKILKDEVGPEQFKTGHIKLEKGDVLFLMTDALARFVLKNNQVLFDLMSIKNFEEFKTYIIEKWDSKVLEEDDITAILIYLDKNEGLAEFLPLDDFSFPKEEKPEYTKITYPLLNNHKLTEVEMHEIQREIKNLDNKLQGLENHNRLLKKDLNFFKIVTLFTLGISLLSISLGSYSWVKSFISKMKFNTESGSIQTNDHAPQKIVAPRVIDSNLNENLNDNNKKQEVQKSTLGKSNNSDTSVEQNEKQLDRSAASSDKIIDKPNSKSINDKQSPSVKTDNKNGQ